MWRKALCFFLLILLIAPVSPLAAQASADPDVIKGIALVDEGDYDGAILTLDNAARRLAADKSKVKDLSQAYLYLGIAYMGKGHEAAARAKFREAIGQIKDLSLSPDKFPPKVIDAFEAAKEESKRDASNAAAPADAPITTATSPADSGQMKGGGGKVLLIVGGIAAVGVGVAVAAGGGGSASSPTTTTTTIPQDRRNHQVQTGTIPNAGRPYDCYKVVPTTAGNLEATLTWTKGQITLGISCQDRVPPYEYCSGTFSQTSNTSGSLKSPVTQQEYSVCAENYSGVQDTYNLEIFYP
jgi:tetratricopeptide (TPR) repeat protein